MRLELPGVASDEIRVNVDRDRVRVSGVRRSPDGESIRRLHQAEIAFGPFERSVQISTPFDRDRVTARLEDGFLEVSVPKRIPVPQSCGGDVKVSSENDPRDDAPAEDSQDWFEDEFMTPVRGDRRDGYRSQQRRCRGAGSRHRCSGGVACSAS